MGLQFGGFKSSETKRGKINSLKALNFMQILKFALGTQKKTMKRLNVFHQCQVRLHKCLQMI